MSDAETEATYTPAGGSPTALAPHHLRMFALLVDYMLAVVLMNLTAKVLLGAHWDLRPVSQGGPSAVWVIGGLSLLFLRDSAGGISPGKWVTGIAVARADEPANPPTWTACVIRNLTLILLPVEVVMVFVDTYCRRIGDRLAGTVVVAVPAPAPITRRILGLTILFLATTLAIFVVEFWNVRRSASYPIAQRMVAVDSEVLSVFGDGVEFSAPGLERSADGSSMIVHLSAEGPNGDGAVAAHLRLQGPPNHWEPDRVDIMRRPDGSVAAPRIEDAPPAENR